NPRSELEGHQARETGDRASTVAHFVGFVSFTIASLGLTPQALCCRLLRRLKMPKNFVYGVLSSRGPCSDQENSSRLAGYFRCILSTTLQHKFQRVRLNKQFCLNASK